jgi:hypothetical protein
MLDRLAGQPRKTLLVGLGALVAVLAVVNVYEARTPVDTTPVTRTGPSAADTAKPASMALKTPLDARPAGSFSETVSRPIFNAARKPVERQQPAAAAIVGPEDLRLVGILQTASGTKRALIRTGGDSKGQWLVEGGAVSGWTVKSIGPRSVVVASGGRDYEIAMSKGAGRQ